MVKQTNTLEPEQSKRQKALTGDSLDGLGCRAAAGACVDCQVVHGRVRAWIARSCVDDGCAVYLFVLPIRGVVRTVT